MQSDFFLNQNFRKLPDELFEQLFKTYFYKLYLFALRFVKDPALSEDLVQDVFENLWQKRHEIDLSAISSSYLYRCVQNKCIDQFKHASIHLKYSKHVELNDSDFDAGNGFIEPDLEQKINEAVQSLPENWKTVFELSREHGLTYSQIAEKLSISVKTVEATMSKALKHLRDKLSPYYILLLILWNR